MSLEKIQCPICKNTMKKAKVKLVIKTILPDGTTGDKEVPFTICKNCHNMQIFPDIYQHNEYQKFFTE